MSGKKKDQAKPIGRPRKGVRRDPSQLLGFPLVFLTAFLTILLGMRGTALYAAQHGLDFSQTTTLYAAIQYFKNTGGVLESPIPNELELVRFLAPVLTAYAVYLGMITAFRARFLALRARSYRRHTIVCGAGEMGSTLALNLVQAGSRVVVIEAQRSLPVLATLREAGIPVVSGDAREENSLRWAGLARASSVIVLCGSDERNLAVAQQVRRLVPPGRMPKLALLLHITDLTLWAFLQRQSFVLDPEAGVRLELLNVYEQGARWFLGDLAAAEDRPGPQRLMLVGWGKLTEQLLLRTARQWTLARGQDPRKQEVLLLERGAAERVRALHAAYSLVGQACSLAAAEGDPAEVLDLPGPALRRLLQDFRPDRVFVCPDQPGAGLRAALRMLQAGLPEGARLVLHDDEDTSLLAHLRAGWPGDPSTRPLDVVGLADRVCRPDLVRTGLHERLAQAIHEEYLQTELGKGRAPGSTPALVPWADLSEALRESNRNQAAHILPKLQAIGCEIGPWVDGGAERYKFDPPEIETIARLEHERWVAERSAQGWTQASTRDDARKHHPSLVDWESPTLSEEERDKDRAAALRIPGILALAGYQVVRIGKAFTQGRRNTA